MANPNVTMRHLRVFLEIVSQRSLRRAAEALHITESAVSKTLAELESELKSVMLLRDRRGVVLTPAGEDFHRHAAQSMASFARAVSAAQGRWTQRPFLRIGALPTAAASVVPPAVDALMKQQSDLRMEVTSGPFDYLVHKLRLGELNLLVGRMISRDSAGLVFERLYDEDVLAIVRRHHPLVQRQGAVSVDQLVQYPIIVPAVGAQVRAMVDDFLFASGAMPSLTLIESQSETFSRAFVVDSDAVWFAPAGVAQLDIRLGTLSALPIASPLLTAPIGVTTVADVPLSRNALAFIQLLRQHQPD